MWLYSLCFNDNSRWKTMFSDKIMSFVRLFRLDFLLLKLMFLFFDFKWRWRLLFKIAFDIPSNLFTKLFISPCILIAPSPPLLDALLLFLILLLLQRLGYIFLNSFVHILCKILPRNDVKHYFLYPKKMKKIWNCR